jgi:hypothetical protein
MLASLGYFLESELETNQPQSLFLNRFSNHLLNEQLGLVSTDRSGTSFPLGSLNAVAPTGALGSSHLLLPKTASAPSETSASTGKADLAITFGKMVLPTSPDFGAQGQVVLRVTNQGTADFQGPTQLNLYISTDNNIDRFADGSLRNDGLLKSVSLPKFTLKAGASRTVVFDYANLTSVIAPGAYHLIAEVKPPTGSDSASRNNRFAKAVSAPNADMVVQWNAIALNAIQEIGETTSGVVPTAGSRLLAMTSAAVFDTVNSFEHQYQPYLVDRRARIGVSKEAAVAGAATEMLKNLLPSREIFFEAQLKRSLHQLQQPRLNIRRGVEWGRRIAEEFLEHRANDGSEDDTPYTPPTGDYVWRPDGPNFTAVSPNWGKVTPFGVPDIADFAPDGLFGRPGTRNPDRTRQYAREIEEVRLFGGKENTAVTTLQRTADQTEMAVFWSYDRADTFRPYGQLNQILQEINLREGASLAENSRAFALLNIALADAAIAAWDTKYKELQPRPNDVITGDGQGDPFAATDGVSRTVPDVEWQPLLADLGSGTPPFPDYASGHAAFGGAFAGVLESLYGENYNFSVVSQELFGVVRNYSTFGAAGFEDAVSRVYGGVHVRESCEDAKAAGLLIGQYVAEHLLQPVGT